MNKIVDANMNFIFFYNYRILFTSLKWRNTVEVFCGCLFSYRVSPKRWGIKKMWQYDNKCLQYVFNNSWEKVMDISTERVICMVDVEWSVIFFTKSFYLNSRTEHKKSQMSIILTEEITKYYQKVCQKFIYWAFISMDNLRTKINHLS